MTVACRPDQSYDFGSAVDLAPGQTLDGTSLMPALKGGTLPERGLFWHYPHYGNQGGAPSAAVRRGDWKLIEFFEDNRLELYNLRKDLSEKNNLADKLPDKAKELHGKLVAWRKEVGAQMPSRNPAYDPAKPEHDPSVNQKKKQEARNG